MRQTINSATPAAPADTMEMRAVTMNAMAKRATIASTFGAALEWIDFAAYGAVAATIFPKIFFSAMDPKMGILAAFVTFGVGFFARPLGGLFFGMLGDRLGRKHVLLYTLVLMGVASFLIGCLPTYQSIGILAPLFLVVLRFLQGFALGGEATGAQLMTMEHAPPERRGLFGSFINLGSSFSAAVANGMLFVLTSLLGAQKFEEWGWRVPFLMSFLLVIVGLYIRMKVSETPAFEQAKAQQHEAKVPVIEAFRQYPGTILRLLVVWCAPTACFYVINIFSLTYITKTLELSSQTAFLCLMGANLVAVFTMILGGAVSDRLGRKPTMLMASVLTLVIALSYFSLLDTKNWYLIFFAMAAFVGALQIQSGVQPAFFAEPFPTRVRYSGSAAAYTGSNLVAGGPTPFIAAWLFQHSGGQTWSITVFCVAFIVCSMIAILASPETRHVDIKR
ncbi:MFS transporter [Massilia sp. LXY-6]|uniref:MFS transporter n=1 Tax=Massilia sp. LXY-6 TaxID=3379823 RepID=UPI003EDEF6A8